MTDPQEPQEGWNTSDADDTAQAVIEAARALMRHVDSAIIVERSTKRTRFDIGIKGSLVAAMFYESDDDLPDTFWGNMVKLLAALEAHDEATIESEDA